MVTLKVKYDSRQFALSLALMMSGTHGKTLQHIRKFIITQNSRTKLGDDIIGASVVGHLGLWFLGSRVRGCLF